MERVKDIGCEFNVYRKRSSKNVISISMWKGSPGYVYNLSTSILWWGRNAEILFPGWNVRFYVDFSVYQKKFENDVDWDEIIEQVKKHSNVELWLTFCAWGHNPEDECEKCHIGTFMSMIRFHAMVDPTVEVAVMKNMELLTSPKDSRLIHDWLASGKKYNIVYDPGYFCSYGNERLCEETKLTDTNMILATFGVRKGSGVVNFFHMASQLILQSPELSKYSYGVDEAILTILLKPLLTEENTYISLRTRSNQWLPSNENYNNVFSMFFYLINDINNYTPDELDVLREEYKYMGDGGIIPGTNYQERLNNQILVAIGNLSDKVPEAIVNIFKKAKEILGPKVDKNDVLVTFHEMQAFYFEMFRRNVKIENSDDPDTNFFARARSPVEAELLVYLGLLSILFENIDWPGYAVKRKGGVIKKPVLQEISQQNISKKVESLKKQYKMTRRPMLEDDVMAKRAEDEMIRENERSMESYNKNMKIFTKNIKNRFMTDDMSYEQ